MGHSNLVNGVLLLLLTVALAAASVVASVAASIAAGANVSVVARDQILVFRFKRT